MPRKQITPIFHKVSNLLKISILLAKITRKPIIPRLIALKKSRKLKKEFNLLKHYNYGYIQEYQFSPSNTPLIRYRRKLFKKKSHKDLCSIFFLSTCLGRLRDDQGVDHGNYNYPIDNYHLEASPAAMIEDAVERELIEFSDSCGEEDSVDERAERFIERFYQEMRMQKKETLKQLGGMN